MIATWCGLLRCAFKCVLADVETEQKPNLRRIGKDEWPDSAKLKLIVKRNDREYSKNSEPLPVGIPGGRREAAPLDHRKQPREDFAATRLRNDEARSVGGRAGLRGRIG